MGRTRRCVFRGLALSLLGLSSSGVSAVTLTRGPYLGRPGDTSVAVIWDTDTPAASRLDYNVPGAPPITITEPILTTHHVIAIDGLESGATYEYEVYSDATPLAAASTFTAPRGPAETTFSFAVVGDTATASSEELAVTDQIADQLAGSGVDLLVHTGDVVYPSGQASSYQAQFFTPMADILLHAPVLPALGNHDVRSADGAPLLTTFIVPSNGVDSPSRFYSIRQADALFVCLDVETSTYGAGSPQYEWLVRTLASAAARWKFVFFHEPPYSASNHDGLVRLILCPLFEKYGVDIVFSGHEHLYERTWPIHDFVRDGRGVIYITEGGGGGSPLSVFRANSDTAFAASKHGYVDVRVDGDALILTAYDPDGAVLDSLALDKPAPAPAIHLNSARRHLEHR